MKLVKKGLLALFLVTALSGISTETEKRPDSVSVKSGDTEVRFDSKKAWNLNRIDYKGKRLGKDHSSAHYGTVFSFPKVGFIGSGHDEVETENVKVLEFYSDGKKLTEIEADINLDSDSFKVIHESEIRGIKLFSTIELKNNRIYETAKIKTEKAVPVNMFYNFMRPFVSDMSDFLGVGEEEISGELTDSKKFFIKKEMDWVALYSKKLKTGVVSIILEVPKDIKWKFLLWDVPKTYRKLYFQTFNNKSIPAGFEGTYSMVNLFFEADENNWKDKARSTVSSFMNEKSSVKK